MLIQFLITLLLFLKVDRMKIILEVLEPLERNMTKDCFSPLGKVFVNIKKPFSKTILTTAVRTKYSVIYEKTCHKRLKKEKKCTFLSHCCDFAFTYNM